jgi:hypothetical protein
MIHYDEFEIIRYALSFVDEPKECSYEGRNDDRYNKLELTVPFGTTSFKYKSFDFSLEYKLFEEIKGLQDSTAKHTELFLYIICENNKKAYELFRDFIDESYDYCKDKKDEHVSINTYVPFIGWSKLSNLPKRNMDSIYIPEKEKDKIVNDIKKFYENKANYIKFGIPYKKVYLFEGPPGTGKTSLIFSLASLFNKNLSIITFDKKMDDFMFSSAMRNLSSDSMLLLEDIDALFVDRTSTSSLSFSAILNTLDGVGRKDGQVIFMTTNHVKNLDEALKRPARVDYILTFTYPSIELIKAMFNAYFPTQQNKFKEFYETLSDYKVTIALLQKFMFDNLESEDIVKQLPELINLINVYGKLEGSLYL